MERCITLYDKAPTATWPDIEAPDIAEVKLDETTVGRIAKALEILQEFSAAEMILYEGSVETKFGVVARWGDHVRHDGRAYDPWEDGVFSADFEGAFIKVRLRGDALVEIRDFDTPGSVVSVQLGKVEELVNKMAAEAPAAKQSGPRMGV